MQPGHFMMENNRVRYVANHGDFAAVLYSCFVPLVAFAVIIKEGALVAEAHPPSPNFTLSKLGSFYKL